MLHNPKQPNHLHHHKQRIGSPIKSEHKDFIKRPDTHSLPLEECVCALIITLTYGVCIRPKNITVETISSHSLCQLAHALFVCFALSHTLEELKVLSKICWNTSYGLLLLLIFRPSCYTSINHRK